MEGFLYNADRGIFDWVIEHRVAWLNTPFWLLSQAGNGAILWLVIASGLLVWRKISVRESLQVGIAVAIASTIASGALKPLTNRTRPLALDAADLIGSLPPSTSFPSGHAANSFAAAFVLGALLPRAAIPFYVLAVLVAFSRIYIGVHYPFDVVAGIVVGLTSGALARTVSREKKEEGRT